MFHFAVYAKDKTVHEAHGTNIVPGFPEGTPLVGYSINDQLIQFAKPMIADGANMVIQLTTIVSHLLTSRKAAMFKGKPCSRSANKLRAVNKPPEVA